MGWIHFSETLTIMLHQPESRKLMDCKAIRIGEFIYFMTTSKKLMVAKHIKTEAAYPISFKRWSWQSDMLDAAIKFGLCKKEDADKLKDEHTYKQKKQELIWHKDQLNEYKQSIAKLEKEIAEYDRK